MASLLGAWSCGRDKGETVQVAVALHVPADPNPFADVTTLRASVIRGGEVVATLDTPADSDRIEIPGVKKEGGTFYIVLEGLDGAQSIVSRGRTRSVDPYATDGQYGLMFLRVGAFSRLVPNLGGDLSGAAVAPTRQNVLIAGGGISGSLQSSAQLYELDTAELVDVGSLASARAGAAAVTLDDGRVAVIAGAGNNGPLQSTEIFDPVERVFTSGPALQVGRDGPRAVHLGGGRVLVASGETVAASAEIVDFDVGSSTPVSGSVARRAAAVVVRADGSVLIAGGFDDAGVPLASTEVVNASGGLSAGPDLYTARGGVTPLLLDNGDILLAGGDRGPAAGGEQFLNAVELLDTTSSMTFAPDRLDDRRAAASAARVGAGALVVGGYDAAGAVTQAEWYENDIFVDAPLLAAARLAPSLAPLVDETLMVAAGGSGVLEVYQVGPLNDTANRVDLELRSVIPPAPSPDPFGNASELVVTVFDAAGPIYEGVVDPSGAPAPGVMAADGPSLVIPNFRVGEDITVRLEARDGTGTVLAWGGTTRALTSTDYETALQRFLVSRAEAWSMTATPMGAARSLAGALPLPDGRAIVVAGAGTSNDTAEIFDPQTGTFSTPMAANTARNVVAAVTLDDGRLMFTGSGGGTINVDIFDPGTQGFIAGDTLTDARSFHSMSVLGDGRVVVIGGRTGGAADDPVVDTAEVWDNGTWGAPITMIEGRQRHRSAVNGDGDVVVAGGMSLLVPAPTDPPETPTPVVEDTTEIFDGTGFTAGPTLVQARRDFAMITLPNGSVMVCGGIDGPQGTGAAQLDSCETLAPGGMWTLEAGAMQAPRDDLLMLRLADDRVMVVGGAGGGTLTDIVYPPPSAPGPALNESRPNLAGCALPDGRAVVFGGEVMGTELDTAEVFTPASWTNSFTY